MSRRYGFLALGSAFLALALVLAIRAPRGGARTPSPLPAPRPAATVTLHVVAGAVEPPRVAAVKGSDVTVLVQNRDPVARTVALLGYEDRVAPERIAPGASARFRFEASRPGEDFPWLVDGRPAGTLAVLGSHLVEGHR